MERYELVIRFLQEIGADREAAMYVRLFQKQEPSRFAVIEVGEDLSPVSLHLLAINLSYLCALDLFPVIVHGTCGGRARARGTRARGTHATDVREERARLLALNETLVTAITVQEGSAIGLIDGVFTRPSSARVVGHRRHDVHRRHGGLSVRRTSIHAAIRDDSIPVVAALAPAALAAADLASSARQALVPVPLRTATAVLVERLRPSKVILLNEAGGLRQRDGDLISYINLRLDGERLSASGKLSRAVAAELRRASTFLADLPPRTVLQVTSPSSLLRELFTQRGGGTLLKKGRALEVHEGLAGLSRSRMRKLIERSFGRKLARDYFGARRQRVAPIRSVIADPNYRGVAIVREIEDLAYLDKFAVRPEARGEGIAIDLWEMIVSRHPAFFWRSRPDNAINNWYFEHADGCVKYPEWWIWWKGLGEAAARRAVQIALALPSTLGSRGE